MVQGTRCKDQGRKATGTGFREVKFNSRGLAEGPELVLWLPRPRFKAQGSRLKGVVGWANSDQQGDVGRGVFWLEFEGKFQGLACGVVKLGPGTALLQR